MCCFLLACFQVFVRNQSQLRYNWEKSDKKILFFFARGETAKALFLASRHSGNTRNAIQNGLTAPDACTLRWPRSDLAKENIAIRKRERTSWDDIGE
jgi:hypothetical protein